MKLNKNKIKKINNNIQNIQKYTKNKSNKNKDIVIQSINLLFLKAKHKLL